MIYNYRGASKQLKYKNKKCEYDGKKFDSLKEKNQYIIFKQMEKEGKISNLQCQVPFELQPKFKFNGKTIRPITYIADFTYIENGKQVVVDVKSEITRKDKVYRLKKKMLQYQYNIDLKEI